MYNLYFGVFMYKVTIVSCFFVAIISQLGACATLSKDQCKVGDWRAIGKTDGEYGRPMDYFEKHKSACKEHNIKANTALYKQGRNEGLKSYCKIQHQINLGLQGIEYSPVCKGAIVPILIEANKSGLQVLAVKNDLENTQTQISDVRTQLRSKSIKAAEQERLEAEESRLLDQQDRLRNELQRLKTEGAKTLSRKAKAFYKQS